MKIGIVGLGRMGGNLALQALEKDHAVVGYSKSGEKKEFADAGVTFADSLSGLVEALPSPRVVFVYVPAGEPTEETVEELGEHLQPGDIVVEAGNSHWEDSKRRYTSLRERGIHFLDCGTSGGVDGARRGACFMVGGDGEAFLLVKPVFEDLAVEDGCLHVGPAGSGHFVKLMHNMIEFGMVQAIGEGVELLMRSEYVLDMPALFHNWNHGSVVRSWLVELMEEGFREYGDLSSIESRVEDTGEQVWGVRYAMEKEVPIPLLAQAVWGFYESRDADRPWAKAVAVMRHEYGGHPIKTK